MRTPTRPFVPDHPTQSPESVSSTAEPAPPLLPSWRAWYWLVLGALAAEVAFFTYLTRLFA
ncbi:hypothetical protein [Hymenobacter wooponensis]|uniref:Uncharacterized protein n=1 Tax=Hymenobacter wooponensis TaxID=1525360 RepID=A0A4Z0MUK9_9BACT|nr:hypothetical protein [Hymenobacter wooponensis]TGD82805.1 hypothetical protein EU557_03215 [Hymenobacter wooponensis]